MGSKDSMDWLNCSWPSYDSDPDGPQVALPYGTLPSWFWVPVGPEKVCHREILSWISVSEDPLQRTVTMMNMAGDYLPHPLNACRSRSVLSIFSTKQLMNTHTVYWHAQGHSPGTESTILQMAREFVSVDLDHPTSIFCLLNRVFHRVERLSWVSETMKRKKTFQQIHGCLVLKLSRLRSPSHTIATFSL